MEEYEVLNIEIISFDSSDMILTSGYTYVSGDESDTTAETTGGSGSGTGTGGGNGTIILPPV